MSESTQERGEDRFSASTNLKYGVVEDRIPEEDIYRHDENRIFITQFGEDDRYWLHLGSRVGVSTTIMFDSFRWEPDEYSGTLWLEREVGGETVTTGKFSFHPALAGSRLGLVGEWFAEQIDLSEYRADVQCPRCGDEILNIRIHSVCESFDCDFYCEGHYVAGGDESDV